MMMVAVLPVEHDNVVTMMPVSHTDANSDSDAAHPDPDFDALRDDHWFVAGVRRTGKCRHRQEWNDKKRKQSILHGTLLGWGRSTSRYPSRCALGTSEVCIGLTSPALKTTLIGSNP
jgi:hypothetical protein